MSSKRGGAKKGSKQKQGQDSGDFQLILRNRKVRHDYTVIDTFEVGMVLIGSEVKSLRNTDVQWGDAHARIDDRDEIWLYGLHIGEYKQAGYAGHIASARRKLLMHKKDIRRLATKLQTKGLSLVPTQMYFKRGIAKMELALVQGKRHEDKRADLIDRVKQRDIDRAMSAALKRR